jgi:hypothetical protein
MRIVLLLAVMILGSMSVDAQRKTVQDSVIQFSGLVVTEGDDGDVIILPYTNIGIVGTSRGTNSDSDGFFSIVAKKGETVGVLQEGDPFIFGLGAEIARAVINEDIKFAVVPGITSAIWWMGTLYGLVITLLLVEFVFIFATTKL